MKEKESPDAGAFRVALAYLGFSSIRKFAAVSGVSHQTCTDMLYRSKRHHRCCNISTFAKIYDTLVTAYRDFAYQWGDRRMADQKFLKRQICRWALKTIRADVLIIRAGLRDAASTLTVRKREALVTARRKKYASITKEFCGGSQS